MREMKMLKLMMTMILKTTERPLKGMLLRATHVISFARA